MKQRDGGWGEWGVERARETGGFVKDKYSAWHQSFAFDCSTFSQTSLAQKPGSRGPCKETLERWRDRWRKTGWIGNRKWDGAAECRVHSRPPSLLVWLDFLYDKSNLRNSGCLLPTQVTLLQRCDPPDFGRFPSPLHIWIIAEKWSGETASKCNTKQTLASCLAGPDSFFRALRSAPSYCFILPRIIFSFLHFEVFSLIKTGGKLIASLRHWL